MRNWWKIASEIPTGDGLMPKDIATYWPQIKDRLMSDPRILADLKDIGLVKPSNIQKVLNVYPGVASLISHKLLQDTQSHPLVLEFERERKRLEQAQINDGYLYHVTTKRKLATIKRQGLRPLSGTGTWEAGSHYNAYSQGKIFFTVLGGLNYWKSKIEEMEFHNHDRQSKVVVLRVKADLIKSDLQLDPSGSEDSYNDCYYLTRPVPASEIEVVSA